MLEYDAENMNSDEIYSSLRGVTEAIQSFSYRSQEDLNEPVRRECKKDDVVGLHKCVCFSLDTVLPYSCESIDLLAIATLTFPPTLLAYVIKKCSLSMKIFLAVTFLYYRKGHHILNILLYCRTFPSMFNENYISAAALARIVGPV